MALDSIQNELQIHRFHPVFSAVVSQSNEIRETLRGSRRDGRRLIVDVGQRFAARASPLVATSWGTFTRQDAHLEYPSFDFPLKTASFPTFNGLEQYQSRLTAGQQTV
jgi:hypothetical protein